MPDHYFDCLLDKNRQLAKVEYVYTHVFTENRQFPFLNETVRDCGFSPGRMGVNQKLIQFLSLISINPQTRSGHISNWLTVFI